ncbi:hypothetical protein FRC00_009652 [Tulasnella sp. 408]|nr:hypothetical protein FRC00_009652 [Tulasnella sp. 408]
MLRILRRRERVPGRTGKTVIICQFGPFADLIAERLAQDRIEYIRFHDSNAREKAAAMRRIRHEPRTEVALVTVNPAAIRGLDLRPFDTAFLMDLWWNPRLDAAAFEEDDYGRVKIYKLYFENTVESRIFETDPDRRHSKVAEPTAAGQRLQPRYLLSTRGSSITI